MTGLEEFLKTFGNITVSNVITVALAAVFLGMTYKKIRDYLIKKYEAEKEKDKELKEALEAVRKYPEYRQQSIKIQEKLENVRRRMNTPAAYCRWKKTPSAESVINYATGCSRTIVITRVRSITRAKSGLVWSQKHSGNVSQIMRT